MIEVAFLGLSFRPSLFVCAIVFVRCVCCFVYQVLARA